MISNKSIELLEIWRKNPFGDFSISEIMKFSGKKTKTWTFNALKLFIKANILKSARKGNLDIYSMNLDNPFSFQYLQYLEMQNNLNFPKMNVLSEIINNFPIKNYCLIVFGSFASGKPTKNSDLDICILIENKELEKKIKPYMNDIKLNHNIKIDENYITFEDFVKMLLITEENLAKQIYKNHILFYNEGIYYQILKEANKNGFN